MLASHHPALVFQQLQYEIYSQQYQLMLQAIHQLHQINLTYWQQCVQPMATQHQRFHNITFEPSDIQPEAIWSSLFSPWNHAIQEVGTSTLHAIQYALTGPEVLVREPSATAE